MAATDASAAIREPLSPAWPRPQAPMDADQHAAPPEAECWICLQGGGGLIAPCRCSGSTKWVHRACLDRWRSQATNPHMFTHCRHCDFKFVLERRVPPEAVAQEQERAARRRRIVGKAFGDFFWTATVVQVALMLLAMLIRLCDPDERLVELFNLPQAANSPPVGTGTFVDSLRYHKSTYYLSAIIIAVTLIGVFSVVAFVVSSCHGRARGSARTVYVSASPQDAFFCAECYADCCRGCICTDCQCAECSCARACPACVGESSCGEAAGVFIVLVALMFVFVGLFTIIAGAVAWVQRVIQQYLQTRELRELAVEYVVMDLAGSAQTSGAVTCPAGSPADASAPPSAPPMLDMASAPPPPSGYELDAQQRLWQELQAVYGVRDAPPQAHSTLAPPV